MGGLTDQRASALERSGGTEAGEAGIAGIPDGLDTVVNQPVAVVVEAVAGLRRGGRDGRVGVVAVGEGTAGFGAREVAVEVDAAFAVYADALGVGAGEDDAVFTTGTVAGRRAGGDADAIACASIGRQIEDAQSVLSIQGVPVAPPSGVASDVVSTPVSPEPSPPSESSVVSTTSAVAPPFAGEPESQAIKRRQRGRNRVILRM